MLYVDTTKIYHAKKDDLEKYYSSEELISAYGIDPKVGY